MKLSTIVNKNSSLKAKINQGLKSTSDTSSISVGNVGVKPEVDSININIREKVIQKLSENNFINVPSGPLKNQGSHSISASGMNALIHQNDNKEFTKLDDSKIIGGYRVVETLLQRDKIDCCFRKIGMMVMVVGDDLSFTEYVLTGDKCSNEGWEAYNEDSIIDITVTEDEVDLTEDYSALNTQTLIKTQKDLNQVFKDILLSLANSNSIGDKNHTHDQFNPSAEWVIPHNLNKKPSVTIIDTAGSEVKGAVDYMDSDVILTVSFNFPFSGKATLN